MKALLSQGVGVAKVVNEAKEPSLRPDYLRVKTVAVALNPTDWKTLDEMGAPGCIMGCDYSGIVEELGSECKSDVKKGDKIFGFIHGNNSVQPEDGCFAEYIMARDGIFAKVPESMSMEDASTFGVAVGTCGQAMYQTLKLPLPNKPSEKPIPLLIYGGSTSVGTIGIQLAKLSGCQVITTASPHNFDLVKSRGADVVFDYNDPDVGQKIRDFTNNDLKYAFDTITLPSSTKICCDALSTKAEVAPQYTALLPVPDFPRDDVPHGFTMAYTIWGKRFVRGDWDCPAMPEDYEFGNKFFRIIEPLVAEGKLVPHPATVMPGGLNALLDGLQQLREDKVRGTKLVVRTAETA